MKTLMSQKQAQSNKKEQKMTVMVEGGFEKATGADAKARSLKNLSKNLLREEDLYKSFPDLNPDAFQNVIGDRRNYLQDADEVFPDNYARMLKFVVSHTKDSLFLNHQLHFINFNPNFDEVDLYYHATYFMAPREIMTLYLGLKYAQSVARKGLEAVLYRLYTDQIPGIDKIATALFGDDVLKKKLLRNFFSTEESTQNQQDTFAQDAIQQLQGLQKEFQVTTGLSLRHIVKKTSSDSAAAANEDDDDFDDAYDDDNLFTDRQPGQASHPSGAPISVELTTSKEGSIFLISNQFLNIHKEVRVQI
ncbi:MAG: hypothetical protein EOP45_18650 [Sphingobacteriaceae bacterium]|nr:MAG: hypothetical protein EOP45_18650 [Sphingobacteriaceae bacterium]